MYYLLAILLQTYFAFFPGESKEATEFVKEHLPQINKELSTFSSEERRIAMAIVAPEISQYSTVSDFIELRTLFIMYRSYGKGDFSVGYFQMKPSFIEGLEKEIKNNKELKRKYGSYLLNGEGKETRETRLKRLSTLEWQLRYLAVFIDIAKLKTKSIKFGSSQERLRYWATLYNSGFNLSQQKVGEYQKKRYFPHYSRQKFNYADVAQEFYEAFKGMF